MLKVDFVKLGIPIANQKTAKIESPVLPKHGPTIHHVDCCSYEEAGFGEDCPRVELRLAGWTLAPGTWDINFGKKRPNNITNITLR